MYLSQTDIAILKVNVAKVKSDSKLIKGIIARDRESEHKKDMKEAVQYYEAKHSILEREITYHLNGQDVVDKTKANHKLVHPFHHLLVSQKVGYIVGNPIAVSVESGENQQTHADNEMSRRLTELLGDKFDDVCNGWVKGASNRGIEWLHTFINKKGEFDYVIISGEQIIPDFDSEYGQTLLSVIRYYKVDYIDENGVLRKIYRVEIWDDKEVTFYIESESSHGEFILDPAEPVNPRPHWYEYNTADPKRKIAKSWGKVPFIPLKNNDEGISDLRFVKSLIDDYDLNSSDFSNNLADIQELIWILKGYEGTNLAEFLDNLKKYKSIKVDAEGGAESESAELPKDARDSHLSRLNDDIYTFGMGVDMKTERFGQSPSGIALKFLFANLDEKAGRLIRKMKWALREFIWFAVEYINLVDNKSYDYKSVKFTFNVTMLVNEAEMIDNCKASKGIISDKTIRENHPWVDDPAEEEFRMEEQQQRESERYNFDDFEEDEKKKKEAA